MASDPVTFSMGGAKRIADAVRAFEQNGPPKRVRDTPRYDGQTIVEGYWKADLDAPESEDDPDDIVPTTGFLYPARGNGEAWSVDRTAADQIEVHNRNPDFSASADEYGIIFEVNGEWRPIPLGGGGGHGVAFEIQEMDSGIATCTILMRDNPATTSPGEAYGFIEVEDLIGCFFDESPESALIGRKGFARYMGTGSEAKWIVHSLCCPPE